MFPCQHTSLISKTEMIHIIIINLLNGLNHMVTVTTQTILFSINAINLRGFLNLHFWYLKSLITTLYKVNKSIYTICQQYAEFLSMQKQWTAFYP